MPLSDTQKARGRLVGKRRAIGDGSLTKDDLDAAIVAVRAALPEINSVVRRVLPQPFKRTSSAADKERLLASVLLTETN